MKVVRFRGRGWRVAGGQKVHTVYIVVMVVSLLGAMKLGKRKLQRLHDSYSISGIGPRYPGNPLIPNARYHTQITPAYISSPNPTPPRPPSC